MDPSLRQALARLEQATARLETAAKASHRAPGNNEAAVQATQARLHSLKEDVGGRLDRAIEQIEAVLAEG